MARTILPQRQEILLKMLHITILPPKFYALLVVVQELYANRLIESLTVRTVYLTSCEPCCPALVVLVSLPGDPRGG